MRPSIRIAFAMIVLGGCADADPTTFRPGFGQNQNGNVAVDGGSDATTDASAAMDAGADVTGDAPSDAAMAMEGSHEGGMHEGGSDAGDAGINAFTNAPAYAATTGPSTLNASHNFGGADPTNPAGHACLNCHTIGGAGVPFAMGGTVWKDVGGTMPAPQVQVALRDNANRTVAVYTDTAGNFFAYAAEAGTLAPPEHAGVRNATNTRLMTGAINAGNCNDCHKTGGQTPINVP